MFPAHFLYSRGALNRLLHSSADRGDKNGLCSEGESRDVPNPVPTLA